MTHREKFYEIQVKKMHKRIFEMSGIAYMEMVHGTNTYKWCSECPCRTDCSKDVPVGMEKCSGKITHWLNEEE